MDINKVTQAYVRQDLCKERGQEHRKAPEAPETGDTGFQDRLEVSHTAVLLSKLKRLPNVRQEKINAALELVRQGQATDEASLRQVISRLLTHIL